MKGVILVEIKEQIEDVLNKLRPYIHRDGGDVEPAVAAQVQQLH